MTPSSSTPRLDAAISSIRNLYNLTERRFSVGDNQNNIGTNLKSLTILAFAQMKGLSISQTLPMFCEAWDEVLNNPDGTNHANIRALMRCESLDEVHIFGGPALQPISLLQNLELFWNDRTSINPQNAPHDLRQAVDFVISGLDEGTLRVAEKLGSSWITHQEIKKAVMLSFRINGNEVSGDGPLRFYDKVPTKFDGWSEERFASAGFRVVPPAVARRGSYIAKGAVLMPSYVNVGARVGEGTMIDTWATVGSCAQIGKNVHLSGGVGIGGVLEPAQASPTIIEDNCFIGARSEIVEGVVVEENSVISMGVYIGQSTKICDRETGEVHYGRVPAGSVVVSGSMLCKHVQGLATYCAVIIKRVDAATRAKTAINELLRD